MYLKELRFLSQKVKLFFRLISRLQVAKKRRGLKVFAIECVGILIYQRLLVSWQALSLGFYRAFGFGRGVKKVFGIAKKIKSFFLIFSVLCQKLRKKFKDFKSAKE